MYGEKDSFLFMYICMCTYKWVSSEGGHEFPRSWSYSDCELSKVNAEDRTLFP